MERPFPATFRGLVLLVMELDAWAGGGTSRARRRMTRPEREEMLRAIQRVPDLVEEWSEGNAGFIELDIGIAEKPIRTLSRSGDGWWAGPDDVAGLLTRWAPPGRWDSVFVVYPTDRSFPACGWGCSTGPTPVAGGAAFSSMVSDQWAADRRRRFPEEGFVHEWLHQVEAMYRALGLEADVLPDLHDVDGRTSARPAAVEPFGRGYVEFERETGTWQPWYRDIMTGTVGPKGDEEGPLGLTAERWALRTGAPGSTGADAGSAATEALPADAGPALDG